LQSPSTADTAIPEHSAFGIVNARDWVDLFPFSARDLQDFVGLLNIGSKRLVSTVSRPGTRNGAAPQEGSTDLRPQNGS